MSRSFRRPLRRREARSACDRDWRLRLEL